MFIVAYIILNGTCYTKNLIQTFNLNNWFFHENHQFFDNFSKNLE
jgi:hypothetical protein